MKEKFLKLPYKEIGLEITRKCNLKCKHCMRGDAQNHTVSKDVIDKFLGEIICTGRLILTGGEPFLEPYIISYLFDEIIRRKVNILQFSCVTNGTIKDKSIVDSWNRLSDYIFENFGKYHNKKSARMIGIISVSRDDYHDNDPIGTLKFYREHLNKHCIIVPEKIEKDEDIYMLGRATQNKDLFQSKNVLYHVCPYRLEKDDNCILTNIMVGWDGKIMIGEDSSYEQQDKVNYGNIMKGHIFELIAKGFLYEPFTEQEACMYNLFYTYLKREDFTSDRPKEFYVGILQYFNTVWTVRETARKMFPFLTYEELVEGAYDDINVNYRKTDKDSKILRIDTLEEYDKTISQSQANSNSIRRRALFEGNFEVLLHNNDIPIHPVPIKEW